MAASVDVRVEHLVEGDTVKTLKEVIDDVITNFPQDEEATSNDITPAVLDWMEKIVPGELNVDEYSIAEGWNACRLSILKRIEEGRK